jgi:ornithine cyclodeaminase
MEILVVDGATVARLYPVTDAIELMRQAFVAQSTGAVMQPVRQVLRAPDGGALAVMPAVTALDEDGAIAGLKVMSVRPGNPARGLPAHHGLVVVFDPETGAPAAIIDAAAVTAVRTAAASAVATDALADPRASVLAVLGSGVQARSHLAAMASVRRLAEVRLWSRDIGHARRLAESAERDLELLVSVYPKAADATAGAEIVCTTTASTDPILRDGDVGEGTHINAVGASFAHARELDERLVGRATVFVDAREHALHDAGDLVAAITSKAIGPEHVRAEIGEVLIGGVPGRSAPDEITIFKSVGIAVQDVLSAMHVWHRARAEGTGIAVPMHAMPALSR